MKRLRRVHPLYYVAAVLLVVAVALLAITASPSGTARSASVYDQTPGGAAALRKFFDAMSVNTVVLQGDTFALDPRAVGVLMILAPSEAFTGPDAEQVRRFVDAGGTAVLATESGLFDGALLDAFNVRISGTLGPGTYLTRGVAVSDPPARAIAVDRGVTFTLGAGSIPVVADGGRVIAGIAPLGRGALVVVGSAGPFLSGQLGDADNGRFALALASSAVAGGRTVVFDEYHHGLHPTTDALVLMTNTWPGRALLFIGLALFGYLVLSGRRLGPAIPLDPRPARSSLDYIRGFASLVRRSGHGEIARQRFRHELRTALARELGLDPATPFDRVVAATAPARAAEAKRLDGALERPLHDDALLRTVRDIGRLVARDRDIGRSS